MSDRPIGVKSTSEFVQLQLYPVTGGLSGIKSRKLDKLILNASNVGAALTVLGTLFHSFGPRTANEWSYIVWLLEELDLARGGTTATQPFLDDVSYFGYLGGFHSFLYRVIAVADHPDSEIAVLLPFQSRSVLLFLQVCPCTVGSSGKEFTNAVSNDLNCRVSSIACRLEGIIFHNRGPMTAKDLLNSVWLCRLLDLPRLGTTAL